ncbi:alkaline phosphatase family protein [Kamptonema formosum]|uniref:alkaline phosphatase family protein n=1 Tax=Kamptonema formosum TaxID=331992 RepID=UPI00034696D7|nr:alkaline phosphatase family protein [Oscillatoria sp. PCC 10802]
MTLERKTSPLVILGFDVGDLDSIQRWAKEGYLPTIASIMERGCWGQTGGPELVCSHSLWASMFSGISRNEHGYYYFRQLKPGTYDLQPVSEPHAKISPFWSCLQGTDKKVAVVDAPNADPISELKGIQIADWASLHSPSPASTEPKELLEEVRRVFGPQIVIEGTLNFDAAEDRQIYRLLLERIEKKGALCRHLLSQDRYDVTVIIFCESHIANHQFWRHRPEALLPNQTPEAPDLKDAIRDVLAALDREMGQILSQLPSEANVFILSETGMENQYPTTGLIEAFCRQLGYQAAPEPSGKKSLSPMDLVRKVLPEPVRVAISQRLLSREKRERLLAEQFRNSTNWQKTKAFSIPSFYPGFVRVNLKGREPQGIVEPGAEYLALLDQLEADLMQLKDPETGEPVVRRVERICDLFGGDPPAVLPDLFVQWKPATHFMERVIHPKAELRQQKPEFYRDSDHSHNGFIAAAGPSIQRRGAIADVSLLDLAPTFLSLMGEPIPDKMTGQPLEALAPKTV